MDRESLCRALRPVIMALRNLHLEDPAHVTTVLQSRMPANGMVGLDVRKHIVAATQPGAEWLFGRYRMRHIRGATEISRDLDGFGVHALWLSNGSSPACHYPMGAVALCVRISGTPIFESSGGGWVVFPPGHSHAPTVTGGGMVIIFFLPNNAFTWVG